MFNVDNVSRDLKFHNYIYVQYALPSVVPTKMSVGDIVDRMLDAKIRKLCPSRGLSEDNKEHLKKRLIGKFLF